jgi:hypothetical protein
MRFPRPTFWIAATAAVGLAACSRGSQPTMDEEMKRDLAAVHAASNQMVISPLEAGLSPAPKASERVKQPTRQPAKQVAVAPRKVVPTPAPAPAPKVVVEAPRPAPEAEPAPLPPAPRPAPAASQNGEARRGPYKTEAEIFRQMPWIRP